MRRVRVFTMAVGMFALALLGGCQREPFLSELPRSPYERYMTLRGRDRPATHRNEYGMLVRNARERLQPLEQ